MVSSGESAAVRSPNFRILAFNGQPGSSLGAFWFASMTIETQRFPDRAFLVVPFQRAGAAIQAQQLFVCDDLTKARFLASRIAARLPGVAILERVTDPATGDGVNHLVEGMGAVPPGFPDAPTWSLRLH